MNPYLAWLLAYSALLIALGAWLARRVRGASDFLVAGRGLGPGLVFSTLLAANIGAGTTVGAASLGYQIGWAAWWWVGSAGIGCLILANTIGPRLWRIAQSEDYYTLGDFLERRYNRSVRGWVSLILCAGSLGLLAAQLIAISIVFHFVIGVPLWVGAALGGLVMIVYFTAGGLLSSAWINMLELIVLLAGFLLAVIFALKPSGTWEQMTQPLTARLGPEQTARFLNPFGLGAGGVLYYVALLTPSFIVSPGLIQKIYGARSASAARWGVNLNALALLAFAAIPPALGIIAAAHFPALADPQFAMFEVMTDLLPTWLGVLGLAAIFSAEVSTCDAVLFMITTSVTIDLYRAFWNPRASDRVLLRVSRWTAVVAGLLGVAVAIRIPSIISALTLFYSLVSVALFVPVVVGVYSRRPDATAALAAMGAAVPTTLLIHYGIGDTVLGTLNPFIIGITISLVVIWGVTLVKKSLRT